MMRAGRRRSRLRATAMVIAAGLVACGGESDEDAVRETVTAFVEAGNERDFAAVCELVTEDQRRAIARAGERGCAATLRASGRGAGGRTEVAIDEVRVDGERASVDVTMTGEDGAGRPQTLLVVEEDGEWRLASAGP